MDDGRRRKERIRATQSGSYPSEVINCVAAKMNTRLVYHPVILDRKFDPKTSLRDALCEAFIGINYGFIFHVVSG